jgi:hypothetical protein
MKKLLSILLVCCLTACSSTTYKYQAPTSEVGGACVVQCNSMRQMCADNNRGLLTCSSNKSNNHSQCMKKANKNSAAERSCLDAYYANACPVVSNCEANYRRCHEQCGGRVIKTKE